MALCEVCRWSLYPESGDVFCGVCGTPGATVHIEPALALVFHPEHGRCEAQKVTLENRGSVPVVVEMSAAGQPIGVSLGGEQPRPTLSLRLEPGRVEVTVTPLGELPHGSWAVDVHSAVLRRDGERIPVLITDRPRWRSITPPAPDGVIDVFPPIAGAGAPWLRLRLQEGAVSLKEVRGEGEVPVEVRARPAVPCVLEHGVELGLSFSEQKFNNKTLNIKLILASLNAKDDHVLPLRLHPVPPVEVRARLDRGDDRPIFVAPDLPVTFGLILTNHGAQAASLEDLQVDGPFELVEAVLQPLDSKAEGGPKAEGRPSLVPIFERALPKEVRAAMLPSQNAAVAPREGVTHHLAQLRLRTRPGAAAAIVAGRLEGTLKIRALAAGLAPATAVLPLHVAAQAIRKLDATAGCLLVDYGTVHTCVRLQRTGRPTRELVRLEPMVEAFSSDREREELKSSYRVINWDQPSPSSPTLVYGREAWDHLFNKYESTDYAAKLRLGKDTTRPIRDEKTVLRNVGGVDSARLFLSRVLDRVAMEEGVRPTRVRLSHPVAFDARSRQDLTKALKDLGFDAKNIHVSMSEPEAFLLSFVSSQENLKLLRDAYTKKKLSGDASLVGLIFDFGGGTTDVTIFQYRPGPPDEVVILGSHGYRWLGGEALTVRIAEYLHAEVSKKQNTVFPFPRLSADDRAFFRDLLKDMHTLGPVERENLTDLWSLAESIKTRATAEFAKKDTKTIKAKVVLRPSSGSNAPRFSGLVDFDRGALEAVASKMIQKAIEDTLERISKMSEWRFVERVLPDLVIASGNSSRLWCLRDLFEKQVQEIRYEFPALIAKTGVVDGLGGEHEEEDNRWYVGNVLVERRADDQRWWFMRVGETYRLVLPPGYPADWEPDPSTLPLLEQDGMFLNPYHIFSAPGPWDSAAQGYDPGASEAPRLEGWLVPGDWRRKWCQMAFALRQGKPGMWARQKDSRGAWSGEWRWIPIERDGVM